MESRLTHSKSRVHIILLIIVVCGALLRLTYLFQIKSDPLLDLSVTSDVFDQSRFMNLAQTFLSGYWLGAEVTRYSPVYSYFIAVIFKIFGYHQFFVFLAQSLFGILSIFLCYRCSVLIFEKKEIGLIAAFFYAFYAPFIFYEGVLLRASVLSSINLISFSFILKAFKKKKIKHIFLAGIFLGLSMILRPGVLFFFILGALFFVKNASIKWRMQAIMVLLLSIFMVITPLWIRNNILGSNVMISSQGGSTFWIGNTYDSSGIGLPRTPMRAKLAQETNGELGKTISVLKREIKEHPKEYFQLYLRKFSMFFNGYEVPANLSFDLNRERFWPLRLALINFTIISPLAILGFFLTFRRFSSIGLLYTFLAVLSFSVIIMHIQGRYRLPAIPFFIILAAYSVYWFLEVIQQKRFYHLFLGGMCLLYLSIWTWPFAKMINHYFGNRVRSIDYSNLSQAHALHFGKNRKTLSKQDKKRHLTLLIKNIDRSLEIPLIGKPEATTRAYRTNCLMSKAAALMELGRQREADLVFKEIYQINPDADKEITVLKKRYQ